MDVKNCLSCLLLFDVQMKTSVSMYQKPSMVLHLVSIRVTQVVWCIKYENKDPEREVYILFISAS